VKERLRKLAKNREQLHALCALSNLQETGACFCGGPGTCAQKSSPRDLPRERKQASHDPEVAAICSTASLRSHQQAWAALSWDAKPFITMDTRSERVSGVRHRTRSYFTTMLL
jgi:hypothetical protein